MTYEPYILPDINEKQRPVLYLADGTEVTLKKPFGFAKHPAITEDKNARPHS